MIDNGANLDRHDQRDLLALPDKFIRLNTVVVSTAKPILAESLVGAFTKLVGSKRLSRFMVAGFMSVIIAATSPSSKLWSYLFIRWRKEADHLLTKPRSSQARRQSQSQKFSRWLQCDMIRVHRDAIRCQMSGKSEPGIGRPIAFRRFHHESHVTEPEAPDLEGKLLDAQKRAKCFVSRIHRTY